tara:strand:+ start:1579 stop:1680 length:102 start_codon:yes stop_codon:yes gene_type:complete
MESLPEHSIKQLGLKQVIGGIFGAGSPASRAFH